MGKCLGGVVIRMCTEFRTAMVVISRILLHWRIEAETSVCHDREQSPVFVLQGLWHRVENLHIISAPDCLFDTFTPISPPFPGQRVLHPIDDILLLFLGFW